MDNQINVGISGLGRAGWGIHATTLGFLDELYRVRAVCDPEQDRLREAAERFNCNTYAEYRDFVADENLELVVLATPTHLHSSDSIAALRSGKHVVVEKPMASDLKGADDMMAVAADAGKILTVHQNKRFQADVKKALEVIATGVLGRIVEIRA